MQVPYDPASPAGSDSDLSVAWLPYSLVAAGSQSSTKHGDPNPYFGRVVYGPTLGIDLPVSVTRYGYRDRSNSSATQLEWTTPFTLSLLWDHRWTAVYGLLSTGKVNQPHTPAGGQTTCPALTTTGSNRCLQFSWAQYQSAYDRSSAKAARAWHGTLVEGKRDGSGFAYMRNRVYDGRTGRFTQEDPIGLAGGLNGYGFANGDPVNFSDPFGLTPMDCRVVKCPSITAVQRSAAVRQAGEAMLRASMADNAERGAYLFNGPNGTIRVGEIKVGSPLSGMVEMGPAPIDAIGMLHTHQPIPGVGGVMFPGGPPSGADAALVRQHRIHGVVEEPGKRHFQPQDRGGAYYTVERNPPVKP